MTAVLQFIERMDVLDGGRQVCCHRTKSLLDRYLRILIPFWLRDRYMTWCQYVRAASIPSRIAISEYMAEVSRLCSSAHWESSSIHDKPVTLPDDRPI